MLSFARWLYENDPKVSAASRIAAARSIRDAALRFKKTKADVLQSPQYFNYNDQGSTRAYLCMWYDVPYLNSLPYICDLLSWRGGVFIHP